MANTGTGIYQTGETVYQGYSAGTATAFTGGGVGVSGGNGAISVAFDSTNNRVVVAYVNSVSSRGTAAVGTVSGTSISFATLADELIKQMGKGNIKDVVMPDDLESQYQTYTKADTANLEQSGFDTKSLMPYTEGVRAYITYLDKKLYY
jgi:hypothetical protein